MICYYKCILSALPGKLCQRFFILGPEVAHWLQSGVTKIVLRGDSKKMTRVCI